MKRYAWVVGLLMIGAGGAEAQDTATTAAGSKAVPYEVEPVPFGPGEVMSYRAKWGVFGTVGTGALMVGAVDTVRGQPAYRLEFLMKGRIAFFAMDDTTRSWMDVGGLYAHRFQQKLNQTTYTRDRTLEFLTDEMRWVEERKPDNNGDLATEIPLDDVSFLYFVRTLPLEVGETYTLPRYYKDEGNPVTLQVLRREKIKVPAGEFETIVVKPIIRTDGMFSEGGEAEVWFTDDAARVLVKLQAKMSMGTLKMELEQHTPGTRLVSAGTSGLLHAGK